MSKITLLDQNTIDKIAAGEVVERPAAVVKELVENAIDAGATAVTVEIKGGGIDLIRITDNGGGIVTEDIPIAFKRHATSKIRSVEDLLTVSSLGFRGEALASICAVAQVELITKTRGSLMGKRYVIEGSKEKSLEEIGCPDGTTFVVRNLFYNTPARKKFLKSAQTEAGYIGDFVERLAISRPDISFKFVNNNQLRLHTSGNGNLKEIIYHIYGRDIAGELLKINARKGNLGIQGFVAKPIVSRGNRNYMNYFLNGRYIKSNIIGKAIEEAYKPYTMQHRYPMTALHLTLDSRLLDVNVHPAKMEVRFTNNQEIYQFVMDTVSDALAGKEMIPKVILVKEEEKKEENKPTMPEPFEEKRKEKEKEKTDLHNDCNIEKQIETKNNCDIKTHIKVKTEPLQKECKKEESVPVEKNVFQKQNESVLTASKEEKQTAENVLEIVQSESASKEIADAAKLIEKFEKLEKERKKTDTSVIKEDTSYMSKTVPAPEVKNIEEPIIGKKNSEQISLFSEKLLDKQAKKQHCIIGQVFGTYWMVEYKDKLFIIDQHAAHEKILFERTMKSLEKKQITSQMLNPPVILTLNMREQETLERYLPELTKIGFEIEEFGGREFSVRAIPANLFGIGTMDLLMELISSLMDEIHLKNSDVIMEKVASMSCKAAVKGNTKLSYAEAEALIDELLELDNPYHCPHGRPVIISMSKYELEKKFKRIV